MFAVSGWAAQGRLAKRNLRRGGRHDHENIVGQKPLQAVVLAGAKALGPGWDSAGTWIGRQTCDAEKPRGLWELRDGVWHSGKTSW